MATKKTETKTTTTKTKTTPTRYVGVNSCSSVYVSNGPVQIVDNEFCIWLSKEANNWTSEHEDARYKVVSLGDYEELGEEAFVCDEQTFVKLYPNIPLDPNKKVKNTRPSKQIKFCV